MYFLITCAGSKQKPIMYSPSCLEKLSFNDELVDIRREIIKMTGVNLNWDYTMPAWQLYSGNRSQLYSKIEISNWHKPCLKIKILSALFGWIDYNDFIPIYDLKMTDKVLYSNKTISIWHYWKVKKILHKFINPEKDIDLLSGNYRKAITGKTTPIAITPSINFNDYGAKKGKWLNYQLKTLNC